MQLTFNPGVFALGIAVGVLGLVLLLSLIVAYAYDERTLLGLAAYLSLMVAATLLGQRLQLSDELVQRLLLVAGPALLAGLQLWLLRNRQTSSGARACMLIAVLATLGLLGFYTAAGPAEFALTACLTWFTLLLALSLYLMAQSWHTAGPWKWWLLLGHGAGLVASITFLSGLAGAPQGYWPVVLMLLLQVPPIYLSLVWRSRLLNESRLRSSSANVIDPLTGLATTSVLIERLMRVMSRAHQSTTSSALFLIEVLNWQGLLNELGQEFNEKMLLEAALRLRRSIGDDDLVARISGGRFAVVAQGLAGEDDINALATRLVVSGLRIDSPLLPGVEFKFRVIVSNLKLTRPLALPATQAWLTKLTEHFGQWPGSHRSRSILVVAESMVDELKEVARIDTAY